jgi:hypothetical protein
MRHYCASRTSALSRPFIGSPRCDKQFRLTVAELRFVTYAQRLLELQREVQAEMGSARRRP